MRGILKQVFEAELCIPPEETDLNEWGSYTHETTKRLWSAFKFGLQHAPGRGQHVVARINELGLPEFKAIPEVLDYLDQAKARVRRVAHDTGEVHVIYRQIAVFDPHKFTNLSEKAP